MNGFLIRTLWNMMGMFEMFKWGYIFLINLIVSNGYLFKNASKDRSVSHLFVPVYLRERGPGPHHNGTAKSRRSVRGACICKRVSSLFSFFSPLHREQNDAHLIVKNLRLTVKYGNYHSKRTYFMLTKIP